MNMLLPYDKKQISIEIDDRNFAGALVSRVEAYNPGLSQKQLDGVVNPSTRSFDENVVSIGALLKF